MGTRALTIVLDDTGKELAVFYRQMDGYPSGHGKELVEFLIKFTGVNGFGLATENLANGPWCLFPQIIAHFKNQVGHFYLYPANTRNLGEEYIYYVSIQEGEQPNIKIVEPDWETGEGEVDLFYGSAFDALEFCN